MTVVEELRRWAAYNGLYGCVLSARAWDCYTEFMVPQDWLMDRNYNDRRTFALIVAEALETQDD